MNGDRITVLLIEDNPGDARLVRASLAEAHALHFTVVDAPTLEAGLAELARGAADVVLLDLSLPDAEGLDSISRVRAAAPQVPILVFTGLEDEQLGLQAVRAGAQDYLVKGLDAGSLARGIAHAVERQRMLLELEATRREQLALKDRVLSHVSHELRAPLNAIQGFVTLLMDGIGGDTTPEQREYLELAQRNAEQLSGMIRDLLDATRAETGKLVIMPATVDLAALVDETVRGLRPLAEAKGIALAPELAPELPPAHADPQRVRQIVTNLVDNAVKFTPAGGAVRVRLDADDDPDRLRVSVADTGCGITPEAMERVFERLHQEQMGNASGQRGLGLGLYISRALVEGQGGRIWIEDAPGGGSVFRFTLPCRRARPAGPPRRRAPDRSAPVPS